MSKFAGIVQDELRDLRGNAMQGATVIVREVGTVDPATVYNNPVLISAAGGPDALVNDGTTGLPAAAGLLRPGVDANGNYTFYADTDVDYDLRVLWQGNTYDYRVRPKVVDEAVASVNGLTGEVDLSGTYVPRGPATPVTVPDHALVGNRATSVPAGSQVGLEAAVNFTNPNTTIMQHFVGYSFFSGTPGGSAGSLQGGSCQSEVFNNGTGDITRTALGFEGIAGAGGDNGFKCGTVIGLQGSAFLNSSGAGQNVDNLISIAASGPRRDSGAGTITNAYSFKAEPPTHGTNQFSAHITGRTRLVPSGGLNPLEIFSAGGTLQFAHDGSKLVGYASDGATMAATVDSRDNAPARIDLDIFPAGVKGIRINQRIFADSDFLIFTYDGANRFRVGVAGGLGAFGHAPPAAQPAAPVTLADVIAVLQGCGLAA